MPSSALQWRWVSKTRTPEAVHFIDFYSIHLIDFNRLDLDTTNGKT